jgi:hypothetical protein
MIPAKLQIYSPAPGVVNATVVVNRRGYSVDRLPEFLTKFLLQWLCARGFHHPDRIEATIRGCE